MTKSELKPLYTEATARARITPNQSELAVWHSQLGHGDIRDLRAAIDKHFSASTWMPKESELKPLMEQAQRDRLSQNRGPEELSWWRCDDCGTRITSFRVGFKPAECRGVYGAGHDHGKRCLNTTRFTLLYRGAAA